LSEKRKRVGHLQTVGSVISEHRKVYVELRKGRIQPALASRLSQILVNHRTMLETQALEAELQELRGILELAQSKPMRLINANQTKPN
jgi:hypothetical protein